MVDQLLEKLGRFKTENQVLRSELERSSKEFREEFDYLKNQVNKDLHSRNGSQKEYISKLNSQFQQQLDKSRATIKTLEVENKTLSEKLKRVKDAFATNSN